jgi:hypothetical protein
MLVAEEWFMADGSFFSFSLSSLKIYNSTLFVIDISTPVIILLIFDFFSLL